MTRASILAVLGFFYLSSVALAAEPIIEPSDSIERIVILHSGAVYRGEVVELEPNSHLILRLASGSTRRFDWRDLRRVSGSGSPPSSVTPRVRTVPADKITSREPTRAAAEKPTGVDRPRQLSGDSYRDHLSSGKVLEELGQYSDALSEYGQAYQQKPEPFLLYRMATMQDQLDRPREALSLYRRYLRESPNLPEDRQTEVATNIARLSLALSESSNARSDRSNRVAQDEPARSRFVSVGVMAAGISIWATSYVATAITAGLGLAGTTSPDFQRTYSSGNIAKAQAMLGVLYVPVAGPIISSAIAPAAEWAIPWIFLGAGTQVLGMAMTIAGGRTKRPDPDKLGAWLLPSLGPNGNGLAVVGAF